MRTLTEPGFAATDPARGTGMPGIDGMPATVTVGALFRGEAAPACPDAADFNDDGALNLTDAVYLLTALFRGGPQPPDPGAETCGADPSADELGPCTYTKC